MTQTLRSTGLYEAIESAIPGYPRAVSLSAGAKFNISKPLKRLFSTSWFARTTGSTPIYFDVKEGPWAEERFRHFVLGKLLGFKIHPEETAELWEITKAAQNKFIFLIVDNFQIAPDDLNESIKKLTKELRWKTILIHRTK